MLVQAGVSLQVIQQLGGWSDIKMVLKYSHLNTKQLADAVEMINI